MGMEFELFAGGEKVMEEMIVLQNDVQTEGARRGGRLAK